MPDRPPGPDDEANDEVSAAGTPRWVKVLGIGILVAVVLSIVLLVFGGGHRPGRHTPPASDVVYGQPL